MTDAAPYDALLLLSFGGPEQPADVLPFLRNVTRGRGIPEERLAGVAEHYHHFGGASPINDQNRALLAAVRADLDLHGVDVPVFWGNRNWAPYTADALAEMRDAGVRRAAVLVTAAYASYSGCRQYREDLAAAAAQVAGAPALDKVRHYFDHPGFLTPMVRATAAALAQVPAGSPLAFVTHSVPVAMATTSGPVGCGGAYVAQHREVARLVAEGVAERTGTRSAWELVYCSRSGPPGQPWLEPDVNDHLAALHASGAPGAVLVPIGFVSDHMEVRYDLDTEAAATAATLGLPVARAATVGTAPEFVGMVRELLLERAAGERGERPARVACSPLGPSHDACPAGCCPNPRGELPACCGRAA